jgi:para-nitrobenzyl esterase
MGDMSMHAVVQLSDGAVQGMVDAGVVSFLGIPYAAAPFGPNRMLPPQPVMEWTGVRDATAFGPTAPKSDYAPQYQRLFHEVLIAGDECLNLNVWTPDPGAVGLPVLVWIHGGAFMNGSGSVGAYDGSAFARDGVICVTINYRLSAEGFLYLDDGIANLGLLDQVAALRWVQANISAFGGDPDRVTVAGESAGAMSVTTLLAMPIAQGLFVRAIAQSGAAAHTLTPHKGRTVARYLAEALGVPADRAAIAAVPLERLVATATELATEIHTARDPAKWGSLVLTGFPFVPTVDGTVVPQPPLSAIKAGQGGNVALLIGSNRDEARLFLVADNKIDLINDATLDAVAGAYRLPAEGLALYRANRRGASAGDILAAVMTDWTFGIPAVRVAEARASRATRNTWMYRFDHPDPSDNHRFGACHAVEVSFVFDTIDRDEVTPLVGDAPSAAVAAAVHGTWVNFITNGDPGWAAYDTTTRTVGLLAQTSRAVSDPAADERALWTDIR